MDKQEMKRMFGDKEIRVAWDAEKNERVYAVVDVLEALTDKTSGRKYWVRYKYRIKNAGGDALAAYDRVRMAGTDGKMRLTEAAEAARLKQIAKDLPPARAEELAQWLAAEQSENKTTKSRRRGGRGTRKKTDDVVAESVVMEEIPAEEVQTESTMTEAENDAPKPARKRGRRSRKKTEDAVAEPVVMEEIPAEEVQTESTMTEAENDAPKPARKRGRRSRKKAEPEQKQEQEPKEEVKQPEKSKEKSAQKRSDKNAQKVVTKAVAKVAAKAAVKVAERAVEKAVERPRVDEGERIRMAIGHRESIAVLIDADNAQLSKLKATMDELAKFGRIVVKKAYGDWKNPCLKNWESVLTDLAVKPEQQFAYTKGKNATDIALVIDAMDLLSTGRYDTFAIICSDSDYTPLVMRLRETGAYVFGVGADKTPSPFVNACDVFINTRIFPEETPVALSTAALPSITTPLPVIDVYDVFRLMGDAVELYQDSEGWTSISDAGSHIKRVYPGFRVKKYGYAKLADLVLAYPGRFVTKTYIHKGATILAYQMIGEDE